MAYSESNKTDETTSAITDYKKLQQNIQLSFEAVIDKSIFTAAKENNYSAKFQACTSIYKSNQILENT